MVGKWTGTGPGLGEWLFSWRTGGRVLVATFVHENVRKNVGKDIVQLVDAVKCGLVGKEKDACEEEFNQTNCELLTKTTCDNQLFLSAAPKILIKILQNFTMVVKNILPQ